jgi:hypothetical protein
MQLTPLLMRSLDLASPSNLGMARGGSVMIGVMFMIIGNIAPKMPVPPQRNSFQPDSWKVSRMLRFGGKLFLGLGLAFVLGGHPVSAKKLGVGFRISHADRAGGRHLV